MDSVAAPSSSFAATARQPVGSSLLAERLARVAGGTVLALGPVLVVAQYVVVHFVLERRDSILKTAPLLAALWVFAFVAAAAARRFGRSVVARGIFDDDAFAVASYVVPAVGVALIAPLSLQDLIGLPFWFGGVVTGNDDIVRAFDAWVMFALYGTLHVHVVFALAMGLAAWRFARGDDVKRVALWPAVLFSLVPGVILLFPPLLVWGTGVLVSKIFLARARTWRADDAQLH